MGVIDIMGQKDTDVFGIGMGAVAGLMLFSRFWMPLMTRWSSA